MTLKTNRYSLSSIAWDLWCILSVIGIWPRFIEPRLLSTSHIRLPIPNLPQDLNGFRILQFSDLHLQQDPSDRFLSKLINKITSLKPDLIVFTGDFLCYSQLHDPERLKSLLCSFKAPYGCYAVLGNHDYEHYVSINAHGEYDVIDRETAAIKKGLFRLFSSQKLAGVITDRSKAVQLKKELIDLIKQTPFQLLHNETTTIAVKDSYLNLCGVGEYTLGRMIPDLAFKTYNSQCPGIVLAHNPDSIPMLRKYPGEAILCGHTHGGQVNLPGLSHKFSLQENPKFKRGLLREGGKWVYINRGVGSVMTFRWFSLPEITVHTLERAP